VRKRGSLHRSCLLRERSVSVGLLLTFLGLLAIGWAWAGEEKIQASSASVSYLRGRATAQRASAPAWEPVSVKMVLREGDRVRTLEGARLELTLEDRSVVRFGESSTFILVQMGKDPSARVSHSRIALLLGKIWANVSKLIAPPSTFEIQTQTAIAGTRSTIYRLSVFADRSTMIKVYEGSIRIIPAPKEMPPPGEVSAPQEIPGPVEVPPPAHEVTMEEWIEIIIGAREQISISPQGIPGQRERILSEAGEEEWVAWNQARDGVVSDSY